MTEAPPADPFEDLLAFIRDARGFDLTGYKRSSLSRRIRKRMQDAGISSFSDYRDLLESGVSHFSPRHSLVSVRPCDPAVGVLTPR